jgi:hypothetical protein
VLLRVLPVAVDGVLTGLIAQYLHTLVAPSVLQRVLGEHVQLANAVLMMSIRDESVHARTSSTVRGSAMRYSRTLTILWVSCRVMSTPKSSNI